MIGGNDDQPRVDNYTPTPHDTPMMEEAPPPRDGYEHYLSQVRSMMNGRATPSTSPQSPPRNEKLYPYPEPPAPLPPAATTNEQNTTPDANTTIEHSNETSDDAYEYHQDDLPTHLRHRAPSRLFPQEQALIIKSPTSSPRPESVPSSSNSQEQLLEVREPHDEGTTSPYREQQHTPRDDTPRTAELEPELSDDSGKSGGSDDITAEPVKALAAALKERLCSVPPDSPLALPPNSTLALSALSLPAFSPLNVPGVNRMLTPGSSAAPTPSPSPGRFQAKKRPVGDVGSSSRPKGPYPPGLGGLSPMVAASSTPLSSRTNTASPSSGSRSQSRPTSPPVAPSSLWRNPSPLSTVRQGQEEEYSSPSQASSHSRSFFGNNVI